MTTETAHFEGSGNVFQDLGFPNPELHKVKAGLVSGLNALLEGRSLSDAASTLGLTEPELRRITSGRFRDVSADQLLTYLFTLGGTLSATITRPDGHTVNTTVRPAAS
ncbi:helix-turn-helix domain-containing protein [Deinococcus aluminii]|uniref:HigA2-like helix-turn-helix domain-containing protein n=1 Tax=Deinococcus aluminii TaxID=1656885 RepID=A0ABP9XEW1_9DEIO